ncbi:response regulator [Lachnospiraceae bacterium ZAX-1]
MSIKKTKLNLLSIIGYIFMYLFLFYIIIVSVINIRQLSLNISSTESLLVKPLEELVNFTMPYVNVRAAMRDLAHATAQEENELHRRTLQDNFALMQTSIDNYQAYLEVNMSSSTQDFSEEIRLIQNLSDLLVQYNDVLENKLIPAGMQNRADDVYTYISVDLKDLGIAIRANMNKLLVANSKISTYYVKHGETVYRNMRFLYIALMIMVSILALVVIQKTVRSKKLEEEKETAEDEKRKVQQTSNATSDFLAQLSHEIRTPMNAILGMSELILREDATDTIHGHALDVKQAGTNLLSIISDILDFSKIESGDMDIVKAEYDLASLINDVTNIVRMRTTDTTLLFVADIDPHLPASLLGDVVHVRQILLNLLNNALQYTHKGHIKFSAKGKANDDGQIILSFSVSDTGADLHKEDMETLFGSFAKFDLHANLHVEGTGLGLAIARNLARVMGGDVTATSVPGEGNTFTATIPQEIASKEFLASVEAPDRLHILVFELRKIYADSIVLALTNLGVPCRLASTAVLFEEMVCTGNYPFVFVSTLLFDETVKTLEIMNVSTTLVLLAENNETVISPNVRVIPMPVHSISIANMLNGRNDVGDPKKHGTGITYTAPDARLLIVDDISTNLRVAQGLLTPLNATIDICLSGFEAIELVQENDYDIVFMDHMMPAMDGIETTAAIRALPGKKFQEMVIVALTANAISGMRERFLASGMNDYISKPIEPKKLYDLIHKWIPKEKWVETNTVSNIAPATKRTLLDIYDTDVEHGIQMIGGNEENYINVLKVFSKDARMRFDFLRDISLTSETDLTFFSIHAHALKSAAASIGAANVSELAKKLEFAGKSRDIETIKGSVETFLAELAKLADSIDRAVNPDSNAPSADLMEIINREDLLTLKHALEMDEISTADALIGKFHNMNLSAKNKQVLEEIEENMLIFDMENAIEGINALM